MAAVALRLLAPAFVSPSRGPAGLRRTVVGAEEDKGGAAQPAGAGFMSFLQVDDEPAEIELSPEEYRLALEQEMMSQRKKYYIGGVVKKKNLIVPWKPVDEKEVEKEARRTLKKNGILDPSGEDTTGADDEETEVSVTISGADVRLSWIGGVPGQKVGYIIERKKSGDTRWTEVGTYENGQAPQLLVKSYPGHQYQFTDVMVSPSQYSYRILSKLRGGDIGVVEQKDILVSEPEGIDDRKSIFLLGAVIALYVLYGNLTQTKISWD